MGGEGGGFLRCIAWIFPCSVRTLSWWCAGSAVATLRLSCSTACAILVLQPGIEPPPSALRGRFLNRWTNRKISKLLFLKGHQSHWIRFCPKDLFFTLITSLIPKSTHAHRSCGEDFNLWILGGHSSSVIAVQWRPPQLRPGPPLFPRDQVTLGFRGTHRKGTEQKISPLPHLPQGFPANLGSGLSSI